MTYAGLTTADKGTLLDVKARGAEWIAADQDATIWAYYSKPYKRAGSNGWGSDGIGFAIGVANENNLSFSDPEPVNIDLALAQIAEMETAQTPTLPPLTWNERINQMTVEEKATLFQHDDCFIYKLTGTAYCDRHLGCEECTKQFLNSPYTEGEMK